MRIYETLPMSKLCQRTNKRLTKPKSNTALPACHCLSVHLSVMPPCRAHDYSIALMVVKLVILMCVRLSYAYMSSVRYMKLICLNALMPFASDSLMLESLFQRIYAGP